MINYMLVQLDLTHLLHNNLLVVKHNSVDKDLEKWKFGLLKHMELLTHYKK